MGCGSNDECTVGGREFLDSGCTPRIWSNPLHDLILLAPRSLMTLAVFDPNHALNGAFRTLIVARNQDKDKVRKLCFVIQNDLARGHKCPRCIPRASAILSTSSPHQPLARHRPVMRSKPSYSLRM